MLQVACCGFGYSDHRPERARIIYKYQEEQRKIFDGGRWLEPRMIPNAFWIEY